jgi:hypothetical protein
MASDSIIVNGNQISWGSIVLKLNEERFTGFTGISFSDKRERVKAYGMGRAHAPRGRSRGKYTIEPVKLTGWKESVQIFRQALANLAPDQQSYGDVEFQVLVQYIEPSEAEIDIEIDRCVWMTNTSSDEENPDPLKEEVEFDAMLIRRNNLVLFDNTELVA